MQQRRRRERARSSWPTTTENNNGMGMELVGISDEADEAEQPGEADNREDGCNEGEEAHEGHEQSAFIEEIQTAAAAAENSSNDIKVGAESALLFEDDENKSAMLDSEVVSRQETSPTFFASKKDFRRIT